MAEANTIALRAVQVAAAFQTLEGWTRREAGHLEAVSVMAGTTAGNTMPGAGVGSGRLPLLPA